MCMIVKQSLASDVSTNNLTEVFIFELRLCVIGMMLGANSSCSGRGSK